MMTFADSHLAPNLFNTSGWRHRVNVSALACLFGLFIIPFVPFTATRSLYDAEAQ